MSATETIIEGWGGLGVDPTTGGIEGFPWGVEGWSGVE